MRHASAPIPLLISYEVSLDRDCNVFLLTMESGGDYRQIIHQRPRPLHPDPKISDEVLFDYSEILSEQLATNCFKEGKKRRYHKIEFNRH